MPPASKKLRDILVRACLCLRACVYASICPLRFAYCQERLEIGSLNLIYGISMKNKGTHFFFFFFSFLSDLSLQNNALFST